ncbi:hypothetical protein A3Q56_01508 [Intoshia linei]|uniref:Uncharacterized protein n=1 Tax=Intoshia linei TaxID=1819745 RepID=A0A177B8X9_9BILA|nr:hypothetical protein A3Q56_01508 [Intoshia linei]
MCDTTAVDTGSKNGVFCCLKIIFPNIIYYPCRLHVLDRKDLTGIKKLKPKCNGKILDCYERHLAIETQPLLNVEMTNEICERAFSSLEKFADRHLKDIATKFLIYVNKSFS